MIQIVRDFIINIAAGVALSLATWALLQLIVPRYRAWRYQAPNLAGQWQFYDSIDSTAPNVGIATFTQSGENVKAVTSRMTSRSGKPLSRSFTYRGNVRDGQIRLSFEEPASNGFITGNLVLKLSGDRLVLSGYTVYFDRDFGEVVAHVIIFRKN